MTSLSPTGRKPVLSNPGRRLPRTLCTLVPAILVLAGGCSADESSSTSGTGGTATTGGTVSQTGGISSGVGGTGTTTGGKASTGGQAATGGSKSTGGQAATGGSKSTGGQAATGGSTTTGGSSGGGASGGKGGSGGTPTSGGAGSGGKGGSDSKGGSGGASGGLLPGNEPVKSAGCGKMPALTSGAKTIMVGGRNRDYTIRIPDNYDNNKPYRLIFGMHYIGANAAAVDVGSNILYPYYGIKGLDTEKSAIYIAPTALDGRWTPQNDLPFVDAMVEAAKTGLCIDTTRIFSTGFSYGAIFSYTLACERANIFRAVGTLAAAPILGCQDGSKPVAYLGISGMKDGTCTPAMGRECRDTFVEANGCTDPGSVPDWKDSDGQAHVCYSYEGCTPGYPVRWCTGNFEHIAAHCDQCSPGQDDPVRTWFDDELWNFFKQF